MTIRMADVAGFGSEDNTVKPNKAGNYVDCTLQRIGEDGDGAGEVPGPKLPGKQDNRERGDSPLDAEC